MTAHRNPLFDPFQFTAPMVATRSRDDFEQALGEGYEQLLALVSSHQPQGEALDALDEALDALSAHPRRRRLLETCVWPLLDKAELTSRPDRPEFLWVFTVPFVVTLGGTPPSPWDIPGKLFDPHEFLEAMEQSRVINGKAQLRMVSTLFRREDIQAYGPRAIITAFRQAELDGEMPLVPSMLELDAEIESHRVVTLYALCAARLPRSETKLFAPGRPGCDALAELVTASLRAQGVDVAQVDAMPPSPLAETGFLCQGAGAVELFLTLEQARKAYGPLGVLLRYDMDGMAELQGIDQTGEELLLAPVLSHMEPRKELERLVQDLCSRVAGLSFKGGFALAGPGSKQLQ